MRPPTPRSRHALTALAVGAMLLAPVVATAGRFPFERTQETLPNGLRVVLVPYDSPGLVAYYTLVRTGSRDEVEPGHSGFAHFFEHMMFRGTKRFPSFDDRMVSFGWHNNAWTSNDETVYTDFGPTETLPKVIELEADRFANLDYAEAGFRTEALAVLGEYNKSASRPWLKIAETLLGAAFTTHTYRHTVIGFLDDIKAMPEKFEYSRNFHKRFYTPDNCVIFVVGDFDATEVMAHIRAEYGGWQRTRDQPVVPTEPEQTEERRAMIEWPSTTLPKLVMAYKMPGAADLKAAALQHVLFEYALGETSPLHKDLVLERQLSEPLESWDRPLRDPGLFGVFANAKTEEALPQIEEAVEAAFEGIAAGQVDPDRLARIKSHARYGLILGLDDPEKVASTLAVWISPTGKIDAPDRFLEALEVLTADDLVAFARERLITPRRTVVTLVARPGGKGSK